MRNDTFVEAAACHVYNWLSFPSITELIFQLIMLDRKDSQNARHVLKKTVSRYVKNLPGLRLLIATIV